MHIILCFVYSWMISHLQIVVVFKKKMEGVSFFYKSDVAMIYISTKTKVLIYKPVKHFVYKYHFN